MLTSYKDNWMVGSTTPGDLEAGNQILSWSFSHDIKFPYGHWLYDVASTVHGMNLGANPYVALSGGVDSQAMIHILRAAGVKFRVAIMEFEHGFNSHDVNHALAFCSELGIAPDVFRINVVPFLVGKLHRYVEKYQCPSPQFCTHFLFFEELMHRGATSILCGGQTPLMQNGEWVMNTTRSQTSWVNFRDVNDFPLYGNFLGWCKEIAVPLMLMTPNCNGEKDRYDTKVHGMKRMGLDVRPQAQKYNGFEKVKLHFQELTGDGLMFEKSFRYPHQAKYPEHIGKLRITEKQSQTLKSMHERFNP